MNTVYFDVDDTLIIWKGDVTLKFDKCDKKIYIANIEYGVHQAMIDQLIHHKKINDTIIVWSAGGSKWARIVCCALNIDQYVDTFLSKPTFYYDDNENPLKHSGRIFLDLDGKLTI